jgi:hypothetical protein
LTFGSDLGGLLSAHLFAVGDLPIRGYEPPEMETLFAKAWDKESTSHTAGVRGIKWENGFVYDGQLLRLALDLAKRILPAFYTPTGLPYPRVNLRHGVPFYENSPLNVDVDIGKLGRTGPRGRAEQTETCSAGAGSLVLEFSVLSRLTGNRLFEDLAKRAFWAVWLRRTEIGLIGAGVDAETGEWANSYTGVRTFFVTFLELNNINAWHDRSELVSIAFLNMHSNRISYYQQRILRRLIPQIRSPATLTTITYP